MNVLNRVVASAVCAPIAVDHPRSGGMDEHEENDACHEERLLIHTFESGTKKG